jgi:hypothetical protein
VEDAYYPFGRGNMLEVAFLAAHALGFLSRPDSSGCSTSSRRLPHASRGLPIMR